MGRDVKKVLIVTGEVSGDLHGSSLVREILEIAPSIEIFGIGGKRMVEAGFDPIFDPSRLSVVGITEVLGRISSIIKAYLLLKKTLINNPPDVVILIDYPDFNLYFAREVKKRGIPIIYYISPQIWAWRYGRVNKIAALVDKMVVVFPFEVSIYKSKGVDVEFLGHPILDHIDTSLTIAGARSTLGLEISATIVGLLPGSRLKEVNRLLPPMLESAKLIRKSYPHVRFLLPLADSLAPSTIYELIERWDIPVKVVIGSFYEALKSCDTAIVASGTATLEGAILGIPMVVVYKVSPLTYLLGRRFIKIKRIALANIVGGEEIIPELVQGDVRPQRIASEVIRYLEDERIKNEVSSRLLEVKKKLGEKGSSKRLARLVYETLS